MLGWYFNDDPGLSEVNSNSVISKGDGNEGYIYRWEADDYLGVYTRKPSRRLELQLEKGNSREQIEVRSLDRFLSWSWAPMC